MNLVVKATGGLVTALIAAAAVSSYKSTVAYQKGNPGLAMELIQTKTELADRVQANEVPPPLPPASQDGTLAVDAYKNVLVLGHISSGEFTRLMTAMTTWVAPDQGCAYCHAHQKDKAGNDIKNDEGYPIADPNNLQSDEIYAKRVARRMLQMTMRINGDWKEHVKTTGVTCYTCHRGKPVPANIWYDTPEPPETAAGSGMMGHTAGKNRPAPVAGLTALPGNAMRTFLTGGDENIRVQATEALDSNDRSSIKQTDWTYALMIHMSNALGVNCTYCHNTRSFGVWDTTPAARATAWYGIRMVRELNTAYLEPLTSTFPAERLGPTGDGPKLNCATCHQGAYKPLLGVSMLGDYQVLAEAKAQPVKAPVATAGQLATDLAGDAGAPAVEAGADHGDAGSPSDGGVPAIIVTDAAPPVAPASASAPWPGGSARPPRHP